MGLNKAEVKLQRLLAAISNQDNPRKLVHYVATARELLTVLTGDSAQQNLPSISPEKAREYVDRIEAFAEQLHMNDMPDSIWDSLSLGNSGEVSSTASDEHSLDGEESSGGLGLRRRQPRQEYDDTGAGPVVNLDSATRDFVSKHRALHEDLADDMLGMASGLKQSTLLMGRALQDTEKVLDSAEDLVEHNLASTTRARHTAGRLYSQSFRTTCITWLVIFVMFCMFIFVIAVIRVTPGNSRK